MHSRASINVRVDSNVKSQAQNLFAELGMDLSTAINIFLRQSIKHKGLPFDVSIRTPNAGTKAAIEDSNLHGPFDSVSAVMSSLDA